MQNIIERRDTIKILSKLIFSFIVTVTVLTSVPVHTAEAASKFPGIASEDSNYYWYYGYAYMYGYTYEPIWGVTYENGSGRWTDKAPFQIQSDLYQNFQGFSNNKATPRLIGKASDYGFQARDTYWSSSTIHRVNNPTIWPNVNHTREFGVKYRRTKTTPSQSDASITNHQYKDGNTYWTQPNRTNRVTVIGTQSFPGTKIRLDDYVNRNVLRLSNSSKDIRARISDANSFAYINDSFKDTNTMTISRYSNTHLNTKRDFRTIFNVTPKIHGQTYNVGSYHYSENGKTTSSYKDTGLNLGVDGVAPLHISQSITGAPYKEGSTHWVKSGDELTVTVRQRDAHSGNKYQYLRALGNGNTSTAGTTSDIMARSRHDFSQGTTHHIKQATSNDFDIKSTRRTESTTTYRTVEWKVNPKKHGQVFTLQKYYQDNVNNTSGYSNVGTVKVDDNAPTHNASSILNARYVNGNDYWVRPNDTVRIGLRQHDAHSGNQRQYIRLFGSSQDVRFSHLFSGTSNNMSRVGTSFDNTQHVSVDSADRNENTDYGRVWWEVTPKTHGHSYNLMYYYRDNVSNSTTSTNHDSYGDSGRKLRVDNVAPTVAFNPNGSSWTNSNVSVNVSVSDPDSGLKQFRYRTYQNGSWGSWSSQVTNSSAANVSLTTNGVSRIQVETEDNVGNKRTVTSNDYQIDKVLPNATFSPNSHSWKNSNTSVAINATDTHSGVKRIQYRVYQNGAWDSYSAWINSSSTNVTLSANGLNRIQVVIEDNAGNTRTVTSGNYYIDKTLPNATFSPNSSAWTGKNISVGINSTDAHSGVKRVRYRVEQNGTWGTYQSWVNASSTNVTLSANGLNRIQVQVEDNVGNTRTVTSGNYYIDKTLPNATFSPNSSAWTGKNISVGINSTDVHSGVKRIQYRVYQNGAWGSYGAWINSSSTNVTLSANALNRIEVRVEDNVGNTRTVTSGNYYIDKTLPNATFSPNSSAWTGKNISVGINSTDAHSGVKRVRYRVEQNGTWGSYQSWVSGSSTNVTLSANGLNRIQVQVEDNVGNTRTVTSGNYYIDKTLPNATFSPNSSSWTGKNISVGINSTDAHSGVKRIRYRVEQNGTWGSYQSWINGSSTSLTLSANGLNRIQVQVEDNVGNTRTVTSGNYYIDKVNPTITFRNAADTADFRSRDWESNVIEVKIKAADTHSGVKRIRYAWSESTSTPSSWGTWQNSNNVLAAKSDEGQWYLHAQTEDNVGNTTTNRVGVYKLDKTSPEYIADSNKIENYQYKNGNDHWTQPDRTLQVTLRQKDTKSGNEANDIRFLGNSVDVRAQHSFKGTVSNFTRLKTNTHVNIVSANRTEHNPSTGYGTVKWGVHPVTHGHNYDVQYLLTDYAVNERGYASTGKRIRVDGVAPKVAFRNIADTSNFTSRDWSNEKIDVRMKFSDPDSGFKRTRYAWSESADTPSNWSSWSTSENYVVTQDIAGIWYLHVQTEDNVGNIGNYRAGEYKLNNPPVADFTYEGDPDPIYEGDPLHLINKSTDEDGHNMTAVWTITDPDGITETFNGSLNDPHGSKVKGGNWDVQIHDLTDPTNPIPKAGDYVIKLEVTDQYDGKDNITKTINVRPLQIAGQVNHAERWQEIHDKFGNEDNVYYSGERFMLSSVVTNNSIHSNEIVDVDVTFTGEDLNNTIVKVDESLVEKSRTNASINHEGEIYEEYMTDPYSQLKSDTTMYFDFKATWSNGVIKHHILPITIVDGVYDFYKLHKTK